MKTMMEAALFEVGRLLAGADRSASELAAYMGREAELFRIGGLAAKKRKGRKERQGERERWRKAEV